MSHAQQLQFLQLVSGLMPDFFHSGRVLEIGSNDINGSIRNLFSNCDYVGIDLAEGKGVDIVAQGQEYDAPDGYFDHVISSECFEHNPYWCETFENMIRLCRHDGLVTVTCATTGRPEHGTTRTTQHSSQLSVDIGWEYYLNLTEKDFLAVFDLNSAFSTFQFWLDWESHDLYFLGIRKTRENKSVSNVSSQFNALSDALRIRNSSAKARAKKFLALMFGEFGFHFVRRISSGFRR